MKLKNFTSSIKLREDFSKRYGRKPEEPFISILINIFYEGYEIGYGEGLDEGIQKSEDRIFEIIDCPFYDLCKSKEILKEMSDDLHDCPNGNHGVPCPDFELIDRMFKVL